MFHSSESLFAMTQFEEYSLVIGLLTLPLLGLITLWFVLRRRDQRFARLILFLAVPYLLLRLVERFFFRESLVSLGGLPLFLLTSVIEIAIGVLLALRLFGSYVFDSERPLDYTKPAALRKAISDILDSESFLTALRAALPEGKEDKEYGLDWVPYMLHSIDERRKRVTKSARLFLIATVVAALVFSGVIMYFGYILVNESSAGSAKSLADIKSSTQSISTTLLSLLPSYFGNPRFQQSVVPALDNLTLTESGNKNRKIKEEVVAAITQAKGTGNFLPLSGLFAQEVNSVSRDSSAERAYAAALTDANDKILEFIREQSLALPELASRSAELKVLISKAEDTLNKPENRTPEIIKRLALGVVISTFFLALLRYLGNLYRMRYSQVMEAERDDFLVRKFYVAFKNSFTSSEQRKAVLAGFMTIPSGTLVGAEKESSAEAGKQEFEVLKELLKAIGKKL